MILTSTSNTFEGLKVLPNPSNSILNIKGAQVSLETEVALYTQEGSSIVPKTLAVSIGLYTIDLSGVPNGVYFVNIKKGSSEIVKIIIIIKKIKVYKKLSTTPRAFYVTVLTNNLIK
jgi:hypothetical protein